jgi:hypothetical protein
MKCDASVERAERASQTRAALMAVGAVVMPVSAWAQWGNESFGRAGSLSGMWVLLVALWALVLATGGGLALGRRMRALLNDELSLRNRARAIAAGFYAALGAALLAYMLAWKVDLAVGDALRLVTAAGLSTALLVYSWLERD